MRALAICAAIAVAVFLISGGRFIFLPLVFLPLGFFHFGGRRR